MLSMKSTRKEIIKEKKDNKRIKFGLIILLTLIFFLLLTFKNKPLEYIKSFLSEKTIIKPISENNLKEILINQLVLAEIDVKNINIHQNKIDVVLKDNTLVILSDKNIEKQVTSLQRVLERFKIEGRKVSVIDLRFANPVIK